MAQWPREVLEYLITLIEKAKKGFHVLRCPVFTENIGIVKSRKKVYTSSDVLFSTESIGEEKKKVLIVRDEVPHFLRGPRFQPAYPICKSGPMLTIHIYPVHM